MQTRDVVSKLFCLLKLNVCTTGMITSRMEHRMFTHSEFPQGSALPKYTYPSTFSVMAAAKPIRLRIMSTTAQEV